MPIFTVKNISLKGIAAAVPEFEYNNNSYDWVPENERPLMIKTIGVQTRRIASKGTSTSDLCFVAAEKLLVNLNWKKTDIQALILVTQTSDYQIPSTAIILQDRLKLPKTCMAFDMNLGCSGYVYGLSVISSLMAGGGIKKALLLTGDVSTLNANYKDKSSYPLFGDAGTATALEFDENASPMVFSLNSDGSGFDAIYVPHGGMRRFVNEESLKEQKIADGIYRSGIQIALNGLEVFNFSLREVAPNIRSLLESQGKTFDDVDFVIFHQANRLMNETIRKKLKLSPEKFPYSIGKFGNTSSASIPLTMIYCLSETLSSGCVNLLLSGFGVGLSWGSVLLKTEKLVCTEIIDYNG